MFCVNSDAVVVMVMQCSQPWLLGQGASLSLSASPRFTRCALFGAQQQRFSEINGQAMKCDQWTIVPPWKSLLWWNTPPAGSLRKTKTVHRNIVHSAAFLQKWVSLVDVAKLKNNSIRIYCWHFNLKKCVFDTKSKHLKESRKFSRRKIIHSRWIRESAVKMDGLRQEINLHIDNQQRVASGLL